jgi:hypothetical protein
VGRPYHRGHVWVAGSAVGAATMDIEGWLRSLGLERYYQAFHDNDVDANVLPELTADDLIALGVTSIGHRRKLLAAIAALRPAPQSALETTAVGSTTLARAPAAVVGAERRQVTVMFCDLVGSTALSLQLDPEDLREVIGAYHSCVAQIIGRYDGFVAKYMGDGVLVYFGYPQAHEDDAERAVRAGLALVDAVAAIAKSRCWPSCYLCQILAPSSTSAHDVNARCCSKRCSINSRRWRKTGQFCWSSRTCIGSTRPHASCST